jgi:putative heme-binding domain-containing protein
MRITPRLRIVAAVLICIACHSAGAHGDVERWADPRLPVRDGLLLWLDSARQPAAWQVHGRTPPSDDAKLDVCYDGSGRGRDAVQLIRSSQPALMTTSGGAAIAFDGNDDHLLVRHASQPLEKLTVFIVARPRGNPGNFSAIVSAAESGKNDYATGLNVDLGPFPTPMLELVNVEGSGMTGVADLLGPSGRRAGFTKPVVLTVSSAPGPGGTLLFLDGKLAGRRDRAKGVINTDNLVLGARLYSNTGDPPNVSGFLRGEIAEVLLFDRAMTEEQRSRIEKYLAGKYENFTPPIDDAAKGKMLVSMENPPPVQTFVPGLIVRELPLKLKNVNNVCYRPDGKVIALGYNGDIYLLSDTDGDGLEDKADVFWSGKGKLTSPIGMALTPPGYPRGDGVFIPSKGKLSLILDRDRDGKADEEIIVAQGWPGIYHSVDAMGCALGPDGSVYFSLGTSNFTNAYLIDKGKANYDLKNERGTILRVSPDFSKREIVCTGIRFATSLAFNAAGDLFATDQEGATWLANGNPFDELLHVQLGRHYGFPPRHPKWLPTNARGETLIDEPSVFDYAPQHESTCGFFFNDGVNGGPNFGPAAWKSDAIVCGESRGKLFRTELVKTDAGYVAKNQTIASLTALTVDACLSPKGDVLVTTHSGPPDWGTGPEGDGRLYKISYADRTAPQPVNVWAAGEREVRVAFDRPLDVAQFANAAPHIKIEYGRDVSAGDRFSALWPPYEIVRLQRVQPRGELKVYSVALTPDRRTLVLATDPHPYAAKYALTLPRTPRSGKSIPGEIAQVPTIDLAYDLTGVEASWNSTSKLWLPHLDLAVSHAFTLGNAECENLTKATENGAKVTLRAKLDLANMLRPAVQPGASLDYTWPEEQVTVVITSSDRLSARIGGGTWQSGNEISFTSPKPPVEPVPIEIELESCASPRLSISWHTNEDRRPRAMPLRRILLPWAKIVPSNPDAQSQLVRIIPEIQGGDWLRGRDVFWSEQAICAKCHRIGGEGGLIGPDLSNLHHRDYASVWRDVTLPDAAINPDHVAFAITLNDGTVLAGVPRTIGGGKMIVGEAGGKETEIAESQIKSREPISSSIMPHGIDQILGPAKMKDLMTFLLTEPLKPAPIEAQGVTPPAPRKRGEVDAVLKAAREEDRKPDDSPLRILLASGPKDHGPGEHDYPLFQRRWSKLLPMANGVTAATCQGFPTREQLDAADVVVFFSNNPGFTAEKAKDLDTFLARGGGLVYLHWAVDGKQDADALAERIGLAARGMVKFRHGTQTLSFSDPDHPITRGFKSLDLVDETYWAMVGDEKRIHVLGTVVEDGQPRPQLWTREQGKGRVLVSIGGHYNWTFDDPLFRVIVLRGIAWTAHRPSERLTGLATIGARVAD